MSAKFDTGHSKNVSNFEEIISFCTAQGASYNPSKDSLTVARLKELQTKALDCLQQCDVAKAQFDKALNARRAAFMDLKPFSTRIVNALAASGAGTLAIADVKGITRKIHGVRANGSAKQPASASGPSDGQHPSDKTISSSQTSYDNLIAHFSSLIEILSQEAEYRPNEPELTIAGLKTRLDSMKASNTEMLNRYTSWNNARISRDMILYRPLSGLVSTAFDVKKYVKSVFGASSAQFKQVSGVEFHKR
jgi:hypothetical protein